MVRRPTPIPMWSDIVDAAGEYGITHLGVAPASVLERARTALYERKAAGLDGGMGFTYRNPERSTDPTRAVEGARSVIVAARPYRATDEPPRPDGLSARVARYAWVDHYGPLRDGLRSIARRIRWANERAVAFADDNSIVDREVAYQGGLGWFGKNANLLLAGAGSFFVLGSIVTTVDYLNPIYGYEPRSKVADGCGSCVRCLDGCPTAAIIAPGVVDGNRCLAWLLQRPGTFPVEYREALGDRIYGCDDCQEVCPPAVRRGDRHRIDVDAPQAWVEVVHLLTASDDELLETYGRWYLSDRNPVWLRRNALIVLGNVGSMNGRTGVVVRELLDRYCDHPDAILAEHARWAQQRILERSQTVADRDNGVSSGAQSS